MFRKYDIIGVSESLTEKFRGAWRIFYGGLEFKLATTAAKSLQI